MSGKFKMDQEFITASANLVNGNEALIKGLAPVFEAHITEFDSDGIDNFEDMEWNYLFIVFLMGVAVGARNDNIIEALSDGYEPEPEGGTGFTQ